MTEEGRKGHGGRKASLDMMRSFCVMARHLNLSRSAELLDLTRQTIRRHIHLIEESRGERLFELKDKKYHLTEAGRAALDGAESIVAKGLAWLKGQYDVRDGLQAIRIRDDDGRPVFFSNQHKLTRIWEDGTDLLQRAFHCWVEAKGAIESEKFAPVRPFVLVFRRYKSEWLCAEIGEKSALAKWFGWEWAKSSIGRHIDEIPATTIYGEYIADAYNEVRKTASPRLDHQFRRTARKIGGPLEPMSVQRLLLSCKFPDGDMALVSVVHMTHDVEIPGLDRKYIEMSNPV